MKLEDRLRRAGDLLDAASAEYQQDHDLVRTERRVDSSTGGSPRRPNPRLVLMAALVMVAAAAASIVVLSRDDRQTEVSAGSDGDRTSGPERGAVLLTGRGLLDLDTGTEEPLIQVEQGSFATALATPGPGGDRVYYNSWRGSEELPTAEQGSTTGGRPSIRVKDLTDGSDTVLADGARSVAVDEHGRIAFARGTAPDDDETFTFRYPSEVMVQGSADAEPKRWSSEPGEYLVSAWAGEHLLAARWDRPNSKTDVVVFDGPGRQRVLSRHAVLLALSPDGTTALVDREDQPDRRWTLELVDIATGTARTVDVGGEQVSPAMIGTDPVTVASWVGDTVVVTTHAPIDARSLVFDVAGDSPSALTLQMTFETPMENSAVAAIWLRADRSTLDMLVRTSTPESYRLLTCTIADGTCPGRDLPIKAEVQAGRLRNPSRPLPAGLPVEAG